MESDSREHLRWKHECHFLLQTRGCVLLDSLGQGVWVCACVWVSLSLWIVVPGIPEEFLRALTWVHATFYLACRHISPAGDNVVAALVLMVLTMIARWTSATTIRELWENVYYLWVLGVHGMPRTTQWGLGRERLGMKAHGNWGSASIGVKGGVSRVLWVHSLWI